MKRKLKFENYKKLFRSNSTKVSNYSEKTLKVKELLFLLKKLIRFL